RGVTRSFSTVRARPCSAARRGRGSANGRLRQSPANMASTPIVSNCGSFRAEAGLSRHAKLPRELWRARGRRLNLDGQLDIGGSDAGRLRDLLLRTGDEIAQAFGLFQPEKLVNFDAEHICQH